MRVCQNSFKKYAQSIYFSYKKRCFFSNAILISYAQHQKYLICAFFNLLCYYHLS